MSIKMIYLEPCPFCGGSVKLVPIDEEKDWYGVECSVCNSMTSFSKKDADGGWVDCEQREVVARWNRREVQLRGVSPDMRKKCRTWYLEHIGREPTVADYQRWQKQEKDWYMERLNAEAEMYKHEDAGDRL